MGNAGSRRSKKLQDEKTCTRYSKSALALYLTFISDIDKGGLPLSDRSVATWVKQLQLEGLRLDGAGMGRRVDHYVLLRLSRAKLQRAGQLKALGLFGAPFHCGRAVLVASANNWDGVGGIRCGEVLGALSEHHHTGLWINLDYGREKKNT